jgi:hypothetical protein
MLSGSYRSTRSHGQHRICKKRGGEIIRLHKRFWLRRFN